jgi:hypothetical protein
MTMQSGTERNRLVTPPKTLGARSERGQTLIITALGMVILIALVGLVIDGGHAWGKLRQTQNGSDSVAKAGAVVIQHMLAEIGSPTDGDVCQAVEGAADVNDVELVTAEYTNAYGTVLGPVGPCSSGASIMAGAQGVKATTRQVFDTFLGGVVGIPTFTAQTDTTAVVGAEQIVCPAAAGCGALPVTFPQSGEICDNTEAEFTIAEDNGDLVYDPYELLAEGTLLNASNLAIIPLCPDNPGSVGWLDFGCGNLAEHIENPCNGSIPIPSWEQTHTGNINCCEGELEAKTGSLVGVAEDEDQVVAIPIHDFTCNVDLADDAPTTACSSYPDWSGEGNNNFFHMNFWIGFKLDEANTSGSDTPCESDPGTPKMVNPGGGLGCLKGWIIDRYDSPGSIELGPINPGDPVTTGIVLIE